MNRSLSCILLTLICGSPAWADYFDGGALNALIKASEVTDQAMARGYVAGVQDTHNGRLFCVDPEVKLSQATAIVEKYLADHPEEWHLAAHALVVNAIAKAFPCKGK